VLVIAPLAIDMEAMLGGGPPLAWKPERGTRLAFIPRDGRGPTRWIRTDAFWAWHYANAFENGDLIRLDFPCSASPGIILPPEQRGTPRFGFTRATLDPTGGTIALDRLDDASTEFPRIDDRLTGRPHRYVLVAGHTDNPALAPTEHDRLVRFDMTSGTRVHADMNAALGETIFAPRQGSTGELDGYYLAYGTDFDTNRSALHIWDAAEFPAAPVASIAIPQRVPNGLHGNWFPA
jgi:carotenoid cleavage dioxygenase-like enzyme